MQEEMKKIIWVSVWMMSLVSLISAHSIEKGPVTKISGNYSIELSIDPKFPVTGRDTHLEFIIIDLEGNQLSDLDIELELHKQGETMSLALLEEQRGHYNVEHIFNEEGIYEIQLVIYNEELETEFDLEVDSFGLSGLFRSGVIIIILSTLIWWIYRDCSGRKNG